jgi:hypothetical protein
MKKLSEGFLKRGKGEFFAANFDSLSQDLHWEMFGAKCGDGFDIEKPSIKSLLLCTKFTAFYHIGDRIEHLLPAVKGNGSEGKLYYKSLRNMHRIASLNKWASDNVYNNQQ